MSFISNLIVKIALRRTQAINNTKIQYLSVADTKIYKVTDIDFRNLTIEASETDLSIADVPESEVFDISDFKDFRVSLKNRNVGNIVEFPKRKNVNSQHVRVD